MSARIPAYFERIVASYHGGTKNRCAHLGHWETGSIDPAFSGSSALMSAGEFQAAQQRLDEQMIQLGKLDHRQSVLDVGCGLGGLIEQINERWSEMNLTGLNIDPEQLEICHRIRPQSSNSLSWREGDACQLPFEEGSFDRVFCVEAMFHFSSRSRFLCEVLRVLKPGGRFVASDIVLLDGPGISELPRFAVAAILNDGYGPWFDPWCDQGQAVLLSEELGYREIHHIDATSNTLPSYNFVVSPRLDEQQDPGDPATRAALLLRWLHRNSRLRYDYFTAVKSR